MSRGSLAARFMGWQRRMGTAAGPVGASGEQPTGRPVQVELWIAGTWVDITPYVMVRDDSGHISITRGRRDEGAVAEQSMASFQLNNRDGRFSPRNPRSPYYGVLGRNQPLRISVPSATGGKAYRFWGEISSWPQRWDTTGTDVWIETEAAGIMRRLAQGAVPEHSVLWGAITDPVTVPGLVAYWPMEDPAGSLEIGSPLVSGSAAVMTGTPALAAHGGFGASDPLPTMTDATITGGVAKYEPVTVVQVRFLLAVPREGLANGKVLVQLGHPSLDLAFWELYYSTGGGIGLRPLNGDGALLGGQIDPFGDVRGRPVRVSVELQQNGSSITVAMRYINTVTGESVSATGSVGGTLTRVRSVAVAPPSAFAPSVLRGLPGTAVGHLTVQTVITPIDDLGERLEPSGETAGRRVQRLCAEQGIPFDAIGDLDTTPAMGGQSRAKPLDLMREAELADAGSLFEDLAVFGLGYRTRISLERQDPALVLSYPDGLLSEVPTPVDDDQLVRNKLTVTVDGVSQTAELTTGPMSTAPPPAGIGTYGDDVALNLNTTDASALLDQAGWRLHLGTVDEARYPQISINLAHPRITPQIREAALTVRPGDRIQITNPPPWLPPDTIDQIVLGTTETINHFEHRITYTCAPASPYTVGVLDDDARIDTDGTVLAAAVGTADTSLLLAPAPGQTGLWTTDPADCPFALRVGGEVVTVTAISGTSAPQTATVTRSVNGVIKLHPAGTDARLAQPTYLAL
ncbi:hypothetical protein [Streptomyces jumonjinensis]|uniref:hypothetical protein n=1 Tax=Streptomyces jumonjinensis TaxID=1945 RepID=UPI0037B30C16